MVEKSDALCTGIKALLAEERTNGYDRTFLTISLQAGSNAASSTVGTRIVARWCRGEGYDVDESHPFLCARALYLLAMGRLSAKALAAAVPSPSWLAAIYENV